MQTQNFERELRERSNCHKNEKGFFLTYSLLKSLKSFLSSKHYLSKPPEHFGDTLNNKGFKRNNY